MIIGDVLNPFELPSVSGKNVSSFDYADKSAFLVIVTCNHCKYSQSYWNRIIKQTSTKHNF